MKRMTDERLAEIEDMDFSESHVAFHAPRELLQALKAEREAFDAYRRQTVEVLEQIRINLENALK